MEIKNNRRELLRERYKNNIVNRENKQGARGKQCLKLPEDVKFYKVKPGINEIDILPFIITTEKYPDINNNCILNETEDYRLTFWVHKRIGTKNDDFVCVKKTYNGKCPSCEEYYRLYREGNEKEAKKYKATQRVLYNVIDKQDDSNEILLFDVSFHLFEKEMLEELNIMAERSGGEFPLLSDLEEGYTISFRAKEKDLDGSKFFEFKSFSFHKRKEAYPESILKKTYPLDSYIIIPSYEEVQNVIFNAGVDEEEEIKQKHEKKDNIMTCPNDLNFGEDFDSEKVCDNCDFWKQCRSKHSEIN